MILPVAERAGTLHSVFGLFFMCFMGKKANKFLSHKKFPESLVIINRAYKLCLRCREWGKAVMLSYGDGSLPHGAPFLVYSPIQRRTLE